MEGDFKFNTAISSVMELVNNIYTIPINLYGHDCVKDAAKTIVLLLAPFVPHICEEMWAKLGHNESIFRSEWPTFKASLTREEKVTFVIQINSKVRSKIEIPADTPKDEIRTLVLGDAKTKEWLKGVPLKKFIVVPNKLVNIVT